MKKFLLWTVTIFRTETELLVITASL